LHGQQHVKQRCQTEGNRQDEIQRLGHLNTLGILWDDRGPSAPAADRFVNDIREMLAAGPAI
jgi:hypothetical protein